MIAQIEELTKFKIMSHHHRTDKTIYFVNGSSILYGGLGEVSDFERIKSLEIGFFCIDEASEASEFNYQMLKSRLRWKLPDGTHPPFFGLLASNPESGWVKNTYVTPQVLGNPLPDHTFIQALPTDNPYLPPGYVEDLRRTNPDIWVDRYLAGSWDSMEGQIWPEFDANTHVLDPFPIPKEWPRLRAIDHGQVHPTCCLWMAIDPDGNVFIYREYYNPGIVSAHCAEIERLSKGEEYTDTYLPPECWGRTREKEGRLYSIYDEYQEFDIDCTKANNEVNAGINRVGEFFRVSDTRIHPLTGEAGSPTLFIFRNCQNLILEIMEYTWKSQTGKERGKEAPRKIKDDAVDAMRYGIMSQPSPAHIGIEKTPYESFNWHRDQMVKRNQTIGDYIG